MDPAFRHPDYLRRRQQAPPSRGPQTAVSVSVSVSMEPPQYQPQHKTTETATTPPLWASMPLRNAPCLPRSHLAIQAYHDRQAATTAPPLWALMPLRNAPCLPCSHLAIQAYHDRQAAATTTLLWASMPLRDAPCLLRSHLARRAYHNRQAAATTPLLWTSMPLRDAPCLLCSHRAIRAYHDRQAAATTPPLWTLMPWRNTPCLPRSHLAIRAYHDRQAATGKERETESETTRPNARGQQGPAATPARAPERKATPFVVDRNGGAEAFSERKGGRNNPIVVDPETDPLVPTPPGGSSHRNTHKHRGVIPIDLTRSPPRGDTNTSWKQKPRGKKSGGGGCVVDLSHLSCEEDAGEGIALEPLSSSSSSSRKGSHRKDLAPPKGPPRKHASAGRRAGKTGKATGVRADADALSNEPPAGTAAARATDSKPATAATAATNASASTEGHRNNHRAGGKEPARKASGEPETAKGLEPRGAERKRSKPEGDAVGKTTTRRRRTLPMAMGTRGGRNHKDITGASRSGPTTRSMAKARISPKLVCASLFASLEGRRKRKATRAGRRKGPNFSDWRVRVTYYETCRSATRGDHARNPGNTLGLHRNKSFTRLQWITKERNTADDGLGRTCTVVYAIHKHIVASSKYFHRLVFGGYYSESHRKQSEIELPRQFCESGLVSIQDFESFLDWCYLGKVKMTPSNALGIMFLSDYFCADGLKTTTEGYIEQFLVSCHTKQTNPKSLGLAQLYQNARIIGRHDIRDAVVNVCALHPSFMSREFKLTETLRDVKFWMAVFTAKSKGRKLRSATETEEYWSTIFVDFVRQYPEAVDAESFKFLTSKRFLPKISKYASSWLMEQEQRLFSGEQSECNSKNEQDGINCLQQRCIQALFG